MPYFNINEAPQILDKNDRYGVVLLTNFLLRPDSKKGYLLESFFGLTKEIDFQGVSRGVTYSTKDNANYRVIGQKLIKEDSEFTEQVTIPNNDRVKMSSSALTQVIVTGGVVNYWDGKELTKLKNWTKDEPNSSGATNFDFSNIIDCTHHNDFYLFIKGGQSGFLKTAPLNEQRPDPANFVNGAVSQGKNDDSIGITVLDDRVLLFGANTARFYTFTTTGVYQEIVNIRVSFRLANRNAYCSWDERKCVAVGSVTSQKTRSQIGVYYLQDGATQAIHTDHILKILAENGEGDIKTEKLEPNGYKLLLLHLKKETLCYIENTKKWIRLATGRQGKNYQAYDFALNTITSAWTCAGKENGNVFNLDYSKSTQDGIESLHRLPLETIQKENPKARTQMIDFSFDLAMNANEQARLQSMKVKLSDNGKVYNNIFHLDYNAPYDIYKQPDYRRFATIKSNYGLSIMLEMVPLDVLSINGVMYE